MFNLKKQKLFLFLSVFLTLLSLTSFVNATNYPDNTIKTIAEKVLLEITDYQADFNLSVTKRVFDVEKLRSAVERHYVDMTDVDLAKTIRLLLGESNEIIEHMPEEVVLASLKYEEVITQEPKGTFLGHYWLSQANTIDY